MIGARLPLRAAHRRPEGPAMDRMRQALHRRRRAKTRITGWNQNAMHDLILTGARVIDPSQNHDGIADVAFRDGKVSGFGKNLKRDAGTEVRDVSGTIVTHRA